MARESAEVVEDHRGDGVEAARRRLQSLLQPQMDADLRRWFRMEKDHGDCARTMKYVNPASCRYGFVNRSVFERAGFDPPPLRIGVHLRASADETSRI